MVNQRSDHPTLAQLRRAKGLTQRQIADAMGMTGKAIGEWERGVSEPHLTPLQTLKLMQQYGCKTLEEFVNAIDASMQAKQKQQNPPSNGN